MTIHSLPDHRYMPTRYSRPSLTLAILLAIVVLLGSCNQDSGTYNRPIYTDYTVPGRVVVTIPVKKDKDGKKGEETVIYFDIDHIRHRIYNPEPLPYGSSFDSVRLSMVLSSDVSASLVNLKTNAGTTWTPYDTAKIDFSGGRMQLRLSLSTEDKKSEEAKPVVYDFRIRTYGYDPDKVVWSSIESGLPILSEEARAVEFPDGGLFLLSRLGQTTTLLEVSSLRPLAVKTIPEVVLPEGLRPYTAFVDEELTWALDNKGGLFSSADLREWNRHELGDIAATQLLSVEEKQLYFVGKDPEEGRYGIYRLSLEKERLSRVADLSSTFPVRDGFLYEYSIAGTPHMLLLGGYDAEDRAVTGGFFSSDASEWGRIPFDTTYPQEGGLYVESPDGETLYLIGGLYGDGRRASILRSSDKGVTWTAMSSDKLPGEDFHPLSHAAGYYHDSPEGEEIIIFGGRLGTEGTPSSQIWRATVDRSAGILNDFEEK